jgi:hypothetical protein
MSPFGKFHSASGFLCARLSKPRDIKSQPIPAKMPIGSALSFMIWPGIFCLVSFSLEKSVPFRF